MSDFISTPRLHSYRKILKVKKPNQIMRAYCWNIAVSAALYPVIQTLEVTLRNALDMAVRNNHAPLASSGKPSYSGQRLWFKLMVTERQNSAILRMNSHQKSKWLRSDGTRKKYNYSEDHIRKVEREISRYKTYVQPEDILSNVPFGFWTTFLGEDYEDLTNKHLLWPNLLHDVFPNAPIGYTRGNIEEQFNLVREFRNRFAHHEPVWKFFDRNPLDNTIDYTKPIYGLSASLSLLNKQYDQMLNIISWMSQNTYDSFLASNMHVEFKKLCSLDGFYAYVNKEKISKKQPRSKARREIFKLINSYQGNQILYVKTHKKRGIILGINEPQI